MPGLFGGFGNYFLVLFQGSPEVVYPRVNNFSILILSLSYLFLILSLISEFGGGIGWTLYPPLSTSFMSLSPSSTGNLIFGLLISGISSCLTSLNFWTTILNLRSYYLTLKTMPLFPWALLITGGMLLPTLPILSGALLMVLADLHSNTLFFDPIFGGDPLFYQHLFWFFGHPEVYILIIPAFGIISIIISGILQTIIFGKQSMIFAMSCISLLGSVVWGHHMYTVGLETDTRAYFSGVTILISLPTGTKIFNWLSTYLGNPPLLQLKTNSPFFGLLFFLMFTLGGSTGIILGNAAVDLGLHDTYYVVAHFHFVLSLGAVIPTLGPTRQRKEREERKKDDCEREKPLFFKRHKVVRFLISPKKKKVKIEVNKIMNPAFLLGTAFNIAYWHRKYHSGTICKGVSNPQTSNALSGCEKEEIPK